MRFSAPLLNVLKVAVLLLFVTIALIGIDFQDTLEVLESADWTLVLLSFLLINFALFLRAFRWGQLARQCDLNYERQLDYYAVFYAGWFASTLLPAGLGPAARIATVSTSGPALGQGIAVYILERLVETLGAALLGLLMLSFVISSGQGPFFAAAVGISCATVLLLIVAFALGRQLGWWSSLKRRVSGMSFISGVLTVIEDTFAALGSARPSSLAWITLFSVGIALALASAMFVAALSLDIDATFPVIAAAWAVVNLTSLLPISIQNFGPREGILIAALSGLGESAEAAVALGLLWFALITLSRLPGILGWLYRPKVVQVTQTPTASP
jgi:uncharacterized protein (TIRG00374 family)